MLEIEYANRTLELPVAPEDLLFDLSPQTAEPERDVAGAIENSLLRPHGSAPLHQIASAGKKVMVVCDDYTRTTPAALIVPKILRELNRAGVPDADVAVMIATGTHRVMTQPELEAKLGSEVLSRVSVLQHDANDESALAYYGTTRRGTQISVSRAVLQADIRVGVGSIVPHFPTGWSGGAKILLPGIAGVATTSQMHFLGAEKPHLGGDAESPVREEMEDFARAIGLDFIVNTVHNAEEQVIGVYAGDFVAAHRAGVQFAREVWSAPFAEMAGMTLSSPAPIDHDLSQAGKGILSANNCTRDGGEIVLLSPCWEGYSDTHRAIHDYLAMSREEVRKMASAGLADDPVAAAIALNLWYARARCRITLVTEGVTPAMAEHIGFGHVAPGELSGYLRSRMIEEPALSIGVLRHSAHVVPALAPAHALPG